jgi:tetratricopeptide (TPR) repeat protein
MAGPIIWVKEVLKMHRIFVVGMVLLLVQLPAIADNVSEVHDQTSKLVFPGKGSIGDWRRALVQWKRAYDALHDRRYDDAVAISDEVIKIYPYDAEFYNQLAVALWQRKQPGDHERGIANVRKAIDIKPDKCIFWDNLAKALADDNKLLEARDALVHASQCETTSTKLDEIKRNLKIIDQATEKKK